MKQENTAFPEARALPHAPDPLPPRTWRLPLPQVEQGVRLYNQQKHVAAVKKWKQALRRINKDNDRFITLGYLSQAHLDWGRYR